VVSRNGKVVKQQLKPIGCSIGELVLNKYFIFLFYTNVNAQHLKRLHYLNIDGVKQVETSIDPA